MICPESSFNSAEIRTKHVKSGIDVSEKGISDPSASNVSESDTKLLNSVAHEYCIS